jgi:hypothetical protein
MHCTLSCSLGSNNPERKQQQEYITKDDRNLHGALPCVAQESVAEGKNKQLGSPQGTRCKLRSQKDSNNRRDMHCTLSCSLGSNNPERKQQQEYHEGWSQLHGRTHWLRKALTEQKKRKLDSPQGKRCKLWSQKDSNNPENKQQHQHER